MTSITLLLSCHSSNENYVECNLAVVHIDRAALLQIKKRRTVAKMTKARDNDFVDAYYWDDAEFVNASEEALAQIKKTAREATDDMVVLAGIAELPLLAKVRTDCVQMRVGVDSYISWMAYDHYTSDTMTTESVSISKLSELLLPGKRRKKGGA
jgi:hypothetical protein